jgi:hypothetical protein
MSADKVQRIRRRPLPRTAPIRSATTFLRPPEIPEPSPGRGSSPKDSTPPAGGVVERAVDNAYRVLEDQLRRGREAAPYYRFFFERDNPMSENTQDVPSGVIRLWSEMFEVWLDFLGPFAPPRASTWMRDFYPRWWASAAEPRSAPAPTPAPASVTPQAAWIRVAFDIAGPKPIEVTLDLAPDADLEALAVQDLTALDAGGKPPIAGVKLERDNQRAVVRMNIPSSQPPGTYLGMIVDQARAEQRGTLRVVVRL